MNKDLSFEDRIENLKKKYPSDYQSVPIGDVKKLYAVGCYSADDWQYIHEVLLQDGSLEDNIPQNQIECADIKNHSDTRAVYLLTDSESEELKNHPKVKFVNLDYSSYKADFTPPPEELRSSFRYAKASRQYRNWYDSNILPSNPNSADINRSGYQLMRCSQKFDPWFGLNSNTILSNRVSYLGDGTDVDVVVGDEGCWFGHVEFQNNTGNGPIEYVGGNVLPGNGNCDLLDLVLESPYYIDPAWFNADSANRLTTRWDGTIVPFEDVAREWWNDSTKRSFEFASFGDISVPSAYTRISCNGNNASLATNGSEHGTQCSALAYGRTQGWAFNANKWVINAYGTNGVGFESYFDIVKIFHLYKPNNPKYGTKDPTINSNSWGFRSTSHRTNGFYFYRQGTSGGTGVSYTSSSLPNFMRYVGQYGDGLRMKGEFLDSSLTAAGDELINSGVIFVVAAGNANQKQVGPIHSDFNNYWSTTAQGSSVALASATHLEFGYTAYNTTNRRGYPQQIGKYNDPETGLVVYPAINIGALDDSYQSGGQERKVNYSDMGEEIDCYAPGDGTLTAVNEISGKKRKDTYNASSGVLSDLGVTVIASANSQISGTSSFNAFPSTGKKITTISGSGTVTTLTPSLIGASALTGSTAPTTGNNDDGYWTLSLPFTILFNGISYDTIYVGTNSYITFGGGSEEYSGLSFSNPNLPKIMISSEDNSCQRLYYGTEGNPGVNRTYRIRYEGTNSTTGSLGNPNIVYEVTFYENPSIRNEIDIQIGVNARVDSGITIFYDDKFSGTSSACPVAAGLIATKLQYNRDWTWENVRSWLRNDVQLQDSSFYTGVESTTATSVNWADVNSLEGGSPRVIYDALTGAEDPLFVGSRPFNFTTYEVDGPGLTIIASATAQIPGTQNFNSKIKTGQRITTTSGSGNVVSIPYNVLGSVGIASTIPTTGRSTVEQWNDDGYWTLTLPFNISFNGVSYDKIYVGTNTYITFGAGSSNYLNLITTNPSLPKIMISAYDNYGQRIYYGTEGSEPNRTYRVRFEGHHIWYHDFVTEPLPPNMIYEATFYENAPNQIDIQIQKNYRDLNSFGILDIAGSSNGLQINYKQ